MKIKINVLAMITVLLAGMASAMPTAEEIAAVKPLVAELMKPDMDAMKLGRKSKVDVAKSAMQLIAQADTPAAKMLLARGAFQNFVKGGDYEAAEKALDALLKAVPDYPADEQQELLEKALYPLPLKKAPQLRARLADIRQKASSAVQVGKIKALLEKSPDDPALHLRLATAYALQDDWPNAVAAFAKSSDAALVQAAKAELDSTHPPAKTADLWWSVELPKSSARLASAIRSHAAVLYTKALPALSGLAKVQAERRIQEASAAEVEQDVRLPTYGSKKNPYVTNGLVAMWDGEWNVAFGRHDDKAKKWNDLIGKNHCDPVGAPTFSGKATVLDGNSCWKINATSELLKTVVSQDLTVEVVLSYAPNAVVANEGFIGFGKSDSRVLWGYAGHAPMVNGATIALQHKGATLSTDWGGGKFDGLHVISLTVSKGEMKEMIDSKDIGVSRSGNVANPDPSYLGWIFGYAKMIGNIYSVRIYDRPLTIKELQSNRAVDMKRFSSK